MTQTQPDRIDRLESLIDRVDRKLDAIATEIQASKLEARVFQAKTEERFQSVDTQLADIKVQLRGQDARLWGFVVTLSLAVIGFLAKLAFFPSIKT